ncbi:MAG: phage tail tape measure protein [Rhodothermaceae bacterium]|nr:phage tail tape measure protein [Rhodothermaceae bacterium]MBC15328.1 phage tail tape measure protein [Rhodothermaceae bacterium]
MPSSTFFAGLHLGLDDNLSGPLGAVSRRYTRFERQTLSVGRSLTTVGQQARNAGIGIVALGAAVAAPLVLGVQAAASFEEAMTDVAKVVDFPTPTAAREFTAELREMATQSRLTHEEIAQIAAAGGQRGVAFPELSAYTRQVAQAATAYEISASEAGDAIGILRNEFQLTAATTPPVLDAINALSDSTGAGAPELLNFAVRAGGVAHQLGITGQAAAVFGSRLIELGRPPEIAGRAFSTLASRLADAENQPKRAQAAFAALGFDVAELGRLTREDGTEGIMTFLRAVAQAENPLGALSQTIGMEFADDLVAVTGDLDLLGSRLTQYADEATYAGSVADEYGRKQGTLNAAIARGRNQARDLAITVGNVLSPTIERGAERFGQIVTRVRAWTEANPVLTRRVVIATASVAAFLTVVGGGLIAFGLFAQGAGAALTALGTLSVRLRLARRAYQSTLVAARAYAIAEGVASAASMRGASAFTILATAARARVAAALLAVRLAARRVVVAVGAATISAAINAEAFLAQSVAVLTSRTAFLAFARGAVASVVTSMAAATASVWSFTAALLANPVGLVVAGIVGAAFLIYKYWAPIKAFFVGVGQGIMEAIGPVLPALQPLISFARGVGSAVVGFFRDLFRQANPSAETMERIGSAGRIVGAVLGATVVPAIQLVTGAVRAVVAVGRALVPAFQLVGSMLRMAFEVSPVGLFLAAVRGMIAAARALITGGWQEAGRKLIQGLVSGIRSAASGLVSAAAAAFAPLRRMVPGSPVRSGPLTAFNTAGRSLMELAASTVTPAPLTSALGRAFSAVRTPALAASLAVAPVGVGAAPGTPSPGGATGPAPIQITVHVDARGAANPAEAEAAARRGVDTSVLEIRRVVREEMARSDRGRTAFSR